MKRFLTTILPVMALAAPALAEDTPAAIAPIRTALIETVSADLCPAPNDWIILPVSTDVDAADQTYAIIHRDDIIDGDSLAIITAAEKSAVDAKTKTCAGTSPETLLG